MEALIDLLNKGAKSRDSENASSEPGEGEDASGELMDPAFESGAQEVFEAIKDGDTAAFADALKACIEMAR